MGYSQLSLAVSGKPKEAVLAALALRPTGARQEFAEAPFVCASLPNGWFLVVAQGEQCEIITDEKLRQLSTGCEVTTCMVEEHVMFSESTGWRDGHRVWRVTHDAQRGTENLHTEGELPEAFASIRDRLAAEQSAAGGKASDADYIFDVPVELAMSFTEYRHDMDTPGLAAGAFEVLEPITPTGGKSSFFRRLFGNIEMFT